MRSRWKGLAILATLALVVVAAGYTASAVSTTTTLSGGDSVTADQPAHVADLHVPHHEPADEPGRLAGGVRHLDVVG